MEPKYKEYPYELGRKYYLVSSIEGLYDERGTSGEGQARAGGKINYPLCLILGHKWKNGVSKREERWADGRTKALYARWCNRCGLLSCEHDFDCTFYYEVSVHQFYSIQYEIDHCKLCGRRIYTWSCGVTKSSPEAQELMRKVQKELGVSMTFGGELSTAVSQILETEGVESASSFLRQTYSSGQIPQKGMHLAGY